MFTATVLSLLGFLLSLATTPRWWLLALFPVAGAAFVWRERRVPSPFIDLRTLARNLVLVRMLGQQVGVQMVFYSVFFGLPLWLERVRHLPARDAGLLMLPLAALGVGLSPGRRRGRAHARGGRRRPGGLGLVARAYRDPAAALAHACAA